MRPVYSAAAREAIVARRHGAGYLSDPQGGGLGGSPVWPFDSTRFTLEAAYRRKVWNSIRVGPPPLAGQHYSAGYRRAAYVLAVKLMNDLGYVHGPTRMGFRRTDRSRRRNARK